MDVKQNRKKIIGIGSVVAIFGLLGLAMVVGSHAATSAITLEAESGNTSGRATPQSGQAGAGNGGIVTFGNGQPADGSAGIVKYPADIINANGTQWKVTLPVVNDGKVVEIKPPEFMTYSDKYFHLNDAKDGVVFDVWHGGGTTSNSANPRSELRERYNNDPEGYWNAGSGSHTMEVTGQVNRLTKVKPHVVIAQVHDTGDDVTTWRVEGNQLWISKGDEPHGHLVTDSFKLGEKYRLKYVITNGKYEFYYNGNKVDYSLSSSAKSYFKAGNYLQSNPKTAPGESTSEYSEVVIYSVKISHG